MERDAGASADAVAKPLSTLAGGNVLRGEDAEDRISGILGIYVAGAGKSLEILKVDGRGRSLRSS
jgi:hypothetical protein